MQLPDKKYRINLDSDEGEGHGEPWFDNHGEIFIVAFLILLIIGGIVFVEWLGFKP